MRKNPTISRRFNHSEAEQLDFLLVPVILLCRYNLGSMIPLRLYPADELGSSNIKLNRKIIIYPSLRKLRALQFNILVLDELQ